MTQRKPWDHGGRTTTERGYGWQHQLMRTELMRTVILCEECSRKGRVTPGVVADHIAPLSKGGSRERSNYQLLCKPCAEAKDAKDRGAMLKPKRRIMPDGWPA